MRTENMSVLPLYRSHPHLWLSIALFLACLLFPAFYIREVHEPQLSALLLTCGWLGVLDQHFSWFANPLLFLAFLKVRKPSVSIVLSALSLTLALSFLGYGKLAVSEAPTYANITAYGWGYFLWVMAIGVFLTGQILQILNKAESPLRPGLVAISHVLWIAPALILFCYHYYFSTNSQFLLEKERQQTFDKLCKQTGEHVYKTVHGAKGVFFDPDGGGFIGKGKDGRWCIGGGGVMGLAFVNPGYLEFYETRPYRVTPTSLSYQRFTKTDNRGVDTNTLQSEYSVTTTGIDLPRKLGIGMPTITIREIPSNDLVASTTYVMSDIDGRYCGTAQNHFSTREYVIERLGLTLPKSPKN